jgi:outer membrane protein
MKKIAKLCIPLFLMAICATLPAQKEWTLEDCIKYALDKNIQIKRQELQAEISKENYNQSKFQRLPNLYANLNHVLEAGKVSTVENKWFNQSIQEGNMSVESDLNLFNGFQQRNTIEQNEFNLMRNLKELDVVKNEITLNVATAYLQILLDDELLEVAKNQFNIIQLQVDKTKKLVEVGNKAKGDLYDMLAQAATEKVNLTNKANNLKISYLTLSQLLELDSIGNFKIKRPEILSVENTNALRTVDSVYFDAEKNMPEIKRAEYNLKSYEKGVSIAKGALSPQVSLSGILYSWYDNQSLNGANNFSYLDESKNNLKKELSLSIYIPIFNRLLTKKNISVARINKIDAEYNLEQTKKTLYKQIQQADADASAALSTYNSATESVISNEESFKYTQQKYEVGLVNSVDYNIAKNKLIQANSDQLRAKYDYIFKTKILDFYSGKSILL